MAARLDFIARESLRPTVLAVFALMAVFAAIHSVGAITSTTESERAAIDLVTTAALGGVWLALRRRRPPLAWAHPIAAAIALIVLVNTLAHFFVVERINETTNLMILMVAVPFFLLRRTWLAAMIVAIWLGWGVMLADVGLQGDWSHFGDGLLSVTALALLIHVVYTRTLTRLERMRGEDEASKIALGHALWDTLQSEMRFRRLAMDTFEGILILDQGTILDSNLAAARLFGCQPGELEGQSLLDFFTPDSRALILEKTAASVEEPYDVLMIKQTGDIAPMEMRGRVIPYQGRLAHMVALHDISRRWRAEKELREAKEYAERLYRIVPAAVFTVNMTGTITSLNNRAAEILGYSQEELVGQPCRSFALFPCDRQCSICEVPVARSVYNVECQVRTKSGQVRTVVKNVEPLLAANGTVIGGIESFEDVTERNQREHKLRQLSLAVEQSPSVVVITTVEGDIEYVNPKFETVTGYSAQDVAGRNLRLLKSGLTPVSVYEELWDTVLAGMDWHGEFLNRKKNGELYWERCHISPVRSSKGTITHFIALKEDITARKQAEQALEDSLFRSQVLFRASETLLMAGSLDNVLRGVADSAVTALYADRATVFLLDHEHRAITHFQKGGPGAQYAVAASFDELWEGLTGWALREGASVLSPKHPPDPRESAQVQQRRLDTHCGDIIVVPLMFRGVALGTLTVINHETGRSFVPADVELLESLANQAVIAIENARLVDSLRESEEKFSKVFHASPDAITISVLGEGLNIDANEGFLALTGYTREEVVGRSMYDLNLWIDDQDRERFLALLRTQGMITSLSVSVRHKSGEVRHVLVSADIFELNGVKHLLTISRDITDLVQVAEEREQLIQDLDSFSRTVAHDLKNPISPILGYAEMLIDDGDDLEPDVQHTFLQEILDSARRMDTIIDELLLLARMRQGDVQPQPLEMGRLVTQVLRRMDYMLHQYDATLTLPDSWPDVMGHGPWIEEIWVNYISNALKYGGQPPQVTLGADVVSDTMARFWVQDNGPGLTPEQQQTLFVPYTQLGQVRVEGHGLGLSIVERIASKLGGEVGVEDAPGGGSRFYFTLPRTPD